jgi:hypothetical protein
MFTSSVLFILLMPQIDKIDTYYFNHASGKTEEELEIVALNIVDKMMLFDTIFDITINALLLTGIWFKLKTLKH